ncbi:carboxyl transferase domain-containing protein [Lentzea aerocolonigenes]|uniref:carboxyl transferase domain-containing protein n=1 Tax=Lentzea aerocolonigenes TaxID=68170 RepID=UPI00068C3677|nr:carboxyl transferase domain-containing protein [Lentzea aerocolonigenes]MCP2242209.1 acetyl-CoA/propionyl-CoA carboxylase carboxyl transferase subunit [Lentzea aerocolonigenes]
MISSRSASWLDPGSAVVLADDDRAGVYTARGTITGVPVVLYVVEMDEANEVFEKVRCRHVVAAIDLADREDLPLIGVWRIEAATGTGNELSGGLVHVYAAMMSVSGRVPQILTVAGPAGGGMAACVELADVAISVGGRGLHLDVANEVDARAATTRVLRLLTGSARADDVVAGCRQDLRKVLPACGQQPYDVEPLVRELLDDGTFEALRRETAQSIVVGLGTLGGRAVGVVANNPSDRWGLLDVAAARKASQFVRMCDAFSVPLIVVVDVPAFLPGIDERWADLLRGGAELLDAFASTSVPRVVLITRECYQGAYFVARACSLGVTTVYSWSSSGVDAAAVDEVIDPEETRMKVANALSHRPVCHERMVR